MMEESSLAARIGARLRGLRQANNLTLAKLAEQSGVSVSYLSAVEKGTNLPSLPILARITEALGASIPSVLAEEGQTHTRLSRVPDDSPAAVDAAHPLLQLQINLMRARTGDRGDAPVSTVDRDLFVYVRDGRLTLTLPSGVYTLDAGDALDAKNPGPVTWVAGDHQCVAIWATCPARIP